MNIFTKLKIAFIAGSRELFLKNYKEIEFRAEILAFIILSNKKYNSGDLKVLKEITLYTTNYNRQKSYIINHITIDHINKNSSEIVLKNIIKKLEEDNDFYIFINTFDYEKLKYTHSNSLVLAYQENIFQYLNKIKGQYKLKSLNKENKEKKINGIKDFLIKIKKMQSEKPNN